MGRTRRCDRDDSSRERTSRMDGISRSAVVSVSRIPIVVYTNIGPQPSHYKPMDFQTMES